METPEFPEQETTEAEKLEKAKVPVLESVANEIRKLIQNVGETVKRGSMDISI